MTIILSPKKLAALLLIIVLGLTFADAASRYLMFVGGYDNQFGMQRQLDLRSENNISTWYASTALLLAACLLAMIGFSKKRIGDRYTRHWIGLAVIFLFLSLDEAASLHEMTAAPLRNALHTTGYLYYAWVIPGSIAAMTIGLMYLGFLRGLPSQTRTLCLIAGTLYVGGAVGMEMLEGKQATFFGDQTVMYAIMVGVEESFEMLGVVVLVYALTSYMSVLHNEVRILIGDMPESKMRKTRDRIAA